MRAWILVIGDNPIGQLAGERQGLGGQVDAPDRGHRPHGDNLVTVVDAHR